MRNSIRRALIWVGTLAAGMGIALGSNMMNLTPDDGNEWVCFIPLVIIVLAFIAVGWFMGRKYEEGN